VVSLLPPVFEATDPGAPTRSTHFLIDPDDHGAEIDMTTRRVTAEAYCGPCTDRERCAEFARTNNLVGLWGGVLRHRPNHEAAGRGVRLARRRPRRRRVIRHRRSWRQLGRLAGRQSGIKLHQSRWRGQRMPEVSGTLASTHGLSGAIGREHRAHCTSPVSTRAFHAARARRRNHGMTLILRLWAPHTPYA
jgi:hypothetical protein